MKSVCVFCGSSSGSDKDFTTKAFSLGKSLAIKNITLVYGGAKVGLMGAVADGVLANGGEVIGILPSFLSTKEIAHSGLTKLIITKDMHERKKKMHELSDGFIGLPGGFGTAEEIFETLTWATLNLHQKPISLLNINNYYDELLLFVQKMTESGFLKSEHKEMLISACDIDSLLSQMLQYKAPFIQKYIK